MEEYKENIFNENEFVNRFEEIMNERHNELINKQMQSSDNSTASTNNTDIFILEANESHYGEIQTEPSINDTSFTVVNAPTARTSTRNKIHKNDLERFSSDDIDESTEVLLVIRSEDKSHTKSGVSGTDSDVEILMSEEIVESDWSAGGDEPDRKSSCMSDVNEQDRINNENMGLKSRTSNSISVGSIKQQSSTDQDILSVEELSSGSLMGVYEKLTRKELLNIIHEQALRIELLETQFNRYRSVQQTFFDYVSDLKQQLEGITKESTTN